MTEPKGRQESSAEAGLVAAAGRIVREEHPRVAPDFVAGLLSHAAPEDLLRYDARALAALAVGAWELLEKREPGVPLVRFTAPANGGPTADSVLEIVNDDMPFLLDSVLGELSERGVEVRFVVHPVFSVLRDASGRLTACTAGRSSVPGAMRESFIHLHVEPIDDDRRRAEIAHGIATSFTDVRAAVADWRAMTARVAELLEGLRSNPPPLPAAEIAEAIQFLEWLVANNFTFLGIRNYALAPDGSALVPVPHSGLGVMREQGVAAAEVWNQPLVITPPIRALLEAPSLLVVTKSGVRSRVHRRVYMDYVGVKRFDDDGKLIGEFRIVGLFTSTAYTRSTRSSPYLRRKVAAVVERAGFDPEGHSGKALANVLENYPRDELFQIDEDLLYQFGLAILQLDERPRVRVLPRRDRFGRFVSVLVYVPRERYGSGVRRAIGDQLAKAYGGRVSAFYPFFPEGSLVRVHFIIGLREGASLDPPRAELERAVEAVVRTWVDDLAEELAHGNEPVRARTLLDRYRDAFSQGYRESYTAATAVADIRLIEGLSANRPLGVDFHRRAGDREQAIGLKVWSWNRPIPLSERVPVLENMGFKVVDERTYQIDRNTDGLPDVWFHDMLLERADGQTVDLAPNKSGLEAAFLMVMSGSAENDGYNALVLAAGMMWRDVALIRALSRFLRQVRVPYSQDYMWGTLVKHHAIAADIVRLCHARFDPRTASAAEPEAAADTIATAIESALQEVESLDEDRILRRFVNAVDAAIRTNFYQLDESGQSKPLIAVKFSSRKLDGMPLPKPLYEIFVYSPSVEGVHLRFGKVARGGIRWSDRPQDFRTEILGLVKAQQVKNAVIVPVGAKGGFVPKRLPELIKSGGSREALQAAGTAAYKLFISTLLEVTDNIGDTGTVPPERTLRYDDDDPYLVVAADKGTATFSDIANAIAQEHGFWLDDAFASGGSAGYDHKRMGITARGAWESVKRHFRELDTDIGKTPFTVVGVGDMSGDVFGNGLLRERTVRLAAAFDHRDIFIDPAPDPEASFAERKRLFELPRSSWQDYDKALISKGGGVYSRGQKEIVLSPEAQAVLGFPKARATPQEVIRAILTAPVDLLFFGGIGTYVRAATESDDAVGDRANDAIRISGADLRCKVIGEGANLGMTQRGRVEAALRGIKLNTDAIDNSAGVNTSDIEVNLKIALARPMRDGRLPRDDRNTLLAAMTEDVAALVLRNNYLQSLALSLAERRGLEDLGFEQRLIQTLEVAGELDRAVEFLPDDMEIAERRRRSHGFTRPELAVLLAYAKLSLNHALVHSSVPDDPYLGRELGRYFPKAVLERFPDAVEQHRLRREIISTQLANSMINRGGPSLLVRIADQTGAPADAIACAFAAVRDSYGMIALNGEIDALDNKVAGKLQLDLYQAVQELLLDRLVWFLRNVDFAQGLAAIVTHYGEGIAAVEAALDDCLPEAAATARAARVAELTEDGVPEALARRIASLPALASATDIVMVADRTGQKVATVAATYFAAEAFFRLDHIASAARGIVISDYFDRLALDRALDSIGDAERRLTAAMAGNGAAGAAAVEAWVGARKGEVDRIRLSVNEIANSGLTLSKLSVAASLLGDLVKQ
ncbi:MAG: NAD-glutamate dehydrogenase [Hyphomicrobiales bacterium]|nr:NAD-glutamate dehydrogenase [Hyphomicrobiales bacterium]